jgi:hypothetical protein
VLPFEAAVSTDGAIDLSSSADVIDSFNSSNGVYDSLHPLAHGTVYSNSATVNVAGQINGVVSTKYRRRNPITAPAWLPASFTDYGTSQVTTMSGGTLTAPTRYKLPSITSPLTISPGLLGAGNYAEIWVTGDITGKITVQPGVNVTIYVAGDIKLGNGDIDNRTDRPSSLLIYGIQPPSGTNPVIELDARTDIEASIYAPGHALRFKEGGDFMGSITAKSVQSNKDVRIHYDEALRNQVGRILDYRVANWVEDVR